MRKAVSVVALIASVAALPAGAETVSWRADEISYMGGRGMLGEGTRSYSVEDIVTGRPAQNSTPRTLMLDDTFGLTLHVARSARIDGFGLSVSRQGDRNGFSWEWFDRVDGRVFGRRQGTGRVAISVRESAGSVEIVAVEFLDDARLRYLDDMSKPPGTRTHELLIRSGSVLRVAP